MIKALEEERKARRRASALRWYYANKSKARKKNQEWYARNKEHAAAMALTRLRERPYLYLLAQAKTRARKRGLVCDLTVEWAQARWTGRCELTGIAFQVGKGQGPFSPSIDRRDRSRGYTTKNSRFILLGINMLKHVGTDAQMFRLARAIVESQK